MTTLGCPRTNHVSNWIHWIHWSFLGLPEARWQLQSLTVKPVFPSNATTLALGWPGVRACCSDRTMPKHRGLLSSRILSPSGVPCHAYCFRRSQSLHWLLHQTNPLLKTCIWDYWYGSVDFKRDVSSFLSSKEVGIRETFLWSLPSLPECPWVGCFAVRKCYIAGKAKEFVAIYKWKRNPLSIRDERSSVRVCISVSCHTSSQWQP